MNSRPKGNRARITDIKQLNQTPKNPSAPLFPATMFARYLALLAVVASALTVGASPVPVPEPMPQFGTNFKNTANNNAALANNANAAAKTSKFNQNANVNQGFAFNQAKKDTNAATTAAVKNRKNAAALTNKNANAFNNFGFPGFKGKAFGGGF